MHKKNYYIIAALSIIFCIVAFLVSDRKKNGTWFAAMNKQAPSSNNTTYKPKSFDLTNVIGLSKKQGDEHITLYEGYVNKRNDITQALNTVDRSKPNRTYSPFRELKVEETYAMNGQLLHELYFENMGAQNKTAGPQLQKLIEENFGSLAAFKQDLFDCAQVARGWVITAYCLDDGRLHNFVLEEHNTHVPLLALPLLVLDVYEHAYMIDFGINRLPYLDVFWNNIDWDVAEQRIDRWVNKLK